MSSVALDVSRLSCEAGGVPLLKDVTFSLRSGEFLSIIGPNGAGKTTLVKCINRINRPSAGSIRINGEPVENMQQRRLARLVGYIPQADAVFTGFDVYQFVMLGRYPYFSSFSPPAEADHSAVTRVLEQLGIKHLAGRGLTTLSGGERQKVLIAAALAQSSSILLLDEPTTFLDPAREAEIAGILRQLNQEQGTTIIAVTHDLNIALRLSSSVLLINRGRAAYFGPPAGLLENGALEEVFQTAFRRLPNPKGNGDILVPEHLV